MNRRDVLIGGACLVAAGSAHALRPRDRMSLVHGRKIADAIPESFAGWRKMDSNAIIAPESDNSLAAKLYSEQVSRLYVLDERNYVMLLIAYGDTQSDTLQLHRPEVCYPAFGFQVSDSTRTEVALAPGLSVPGRRLTASTPDRVEHISYWTRIGEYLPVDGNEQRVMKLRTAFQGRIPDGVLVRLSNGLTDANAATELNERFAAAMVRAMRPDMRAALITTEKAQELARRLGLG
ncbi:exosortase-associated protein EpsI, V-type [Sphingomonas flavalba]|uniref:exosortase-associated protein EpsI, V-type n=1 Tax=Sphingomonas flavalba TaxID=2559804 RepID=UPI00109E1FD3|nr:exosortase-associated protein EpsI, V-type [Sphingomonas flavalba]